MTIDITRVQVSLEEGERWRRTLNVTIPADIVGAERQAAIRKLSSRLKLPGFREGKIPPKVVEKRFGPAVDQELVDRVIGEAYRGVLDREGLRPISEGEVQEIDFRPEADLTFQITFDVAPTVDFSVVDGFSVERPSVAIGEDEIEKVLDRVREQEGTWIPVEGGTPADGDMVSVRIQRLSVEGDEPRRYEFVLGKNEAIPQVEESIRTLEVGTQGEFTVAFPDDFPDEERRGESDELRIFLDGRKTLELPELDDAFAAKVGPFDSLEALRTRIREDLEKEAESEAEAVVRAGLMEQLLTANPFEVPDSMIDQYLKSVLGEDNELTEDQFRKARTELYPQAEHAVKRFIAVEELARNRELAATEEEIDERVEAIAKDSGTPAGEVYTRLQKAGRLEQLEREITDRKVFEFLKAGSTITEAS